MTEPNWDGFDISHHNEPIARGVVPSFAVDACKATEGRTFKSPTFDENWEWFRGRPASYRLAYHWLRSDSSMAAQALNLVTALGHHGGLWRGEAIQVDWETTDGIANLHPAQPAEFADRLDQHYQRACTITYSSDWVPGFDAWRQANPDRPLWYANYRTDLGDSGGWAESDKYNADIWQWTSKAAVAGFPSGIDMNHVFNWDTLNRITNSQPEVEVPPVTEPTCELIELEPPPFPHIVVAAGDWAVPDLPHLLVDGTTVRRAVNTDYDSGVRALTLTSQDQYKYLRGLAPGV